MQTPRVRSNRKPSAPTRQPQTTSADNAPTPSNGGQPGALNIRDLEKPPSPIFHPTPAAAEGEPNTHFPFDLEVAVDQACALIMLLEDRAIDSGSESGVMSDHDAAGLTGVCADVKQSLRRSFHDAWAYWKSTNGNPAAKGQWTIGLPGLAKQILGPTLHAQTRELAATAGMTACELVLSVLWTELGNVDDTEWLVKSPDWFLPRARKAVRRAMQASLSSHP